MLFFSIFNCLREMRVKSRFAACEVKNRKPILCQHIYGKFDVFDGGVKRLRSPDVASVGAFGIATSGYLEKGELQVCVIPKKVESVCCDSTILQSSRSLNNYLIVTHVKV